MDVSKSNGNRSNILHSLWLSSLNMRKFGFLSPPLTPPSIQVLRACVEIVVRHLSLCKANRMCLFGCRSCQRSPRVPFNKGSPKGRKGQCKRSRRSITLIASPRKYPPLDIRWTKTRIREDCRRKLKQPKRGTKNLLAWVWTSEKPHHQQGWKDKDVA